MKLIRYTTPFTRQTTLAPVSRDPWSLLDSDLDRLFAPLFGVSPLTAQSEIDADENNYFVRLVLPGIKRDQLTLEWLDGGIEVVVKAKSTGKDEPAPEYRRTLSVPSDVQADKISAGLADGILTLTLPKAESAKPRRIELN
jgi:HSP20 family protein